MDITQLILDDHHAFRRLFAQLEEIDRKDVAGLKAVWDHLHARLDTHAEAEEQLFYPAVLKLGRGAGGKPDAAAETDDAIDDHNDIRDTGPPSTKSRSARTRGSPPSTPATSPTASTWPRRSARR